ncbi:hypothetical protein P9139_05560 [Curtobacterium flaccumfaciens]|nr:hypothetical protein P9139_05560 [Curtobacterium flaccumfaciens]
MSASKYLPPFTADERVTITRDGSERTPVGQGDARTGSEATYADFLGDEVEAVDPVDRAHEVLE